MGKARAGRGERRHRSGAENHTLLRFRPRQSTTGGGRVVLPRMMTRLAQLLSVPLMRRIYSPSAGTTGTRYAHHSVPGAGVTVRPPRAPRAFSCVLVGCELARASDQAPASSCASGGACPPLARLVRLWRAGGLLSEHARRQLHRTTTNKKPGHCAQARILTKCLWLFFQYTFTAIRRHAPSRRSRGLGLLDRRARLLPAGNARRKVLHVGVAELHGGVRSGGICIARRAAAVSDDQGVLVRGQ